MNALEDGLNIQPASYGLPPWRSIARAVEGASKAGNGAPQCIDGQGGPGAVLQCGDDVDHCLGDQPRWQTCWARAVRSVGPEHRHHHSHGMRNEAHVAAETASHSHSVLRMRARFMVFAAPAYGRHQRGDARSRARSQLRDHSLRIPWVRGHHPQ